MSKLACCYRSYYRIAIAPVKDGKAKVSTCYGNAFLSKNQLVVDKNLKDTWNSREFQFQRSLLLRKDWSFCRGAMCHVNPFSQEAIASKSRDVTDTVAKNKIKLDYFAKILELSISYACNNRCFSCYQAIKKVDHCLTSNLVQELKMDIVPFADHVILSGGEPFFAAESLEFINWMISSYPRKKFSVNTNGVLLDRFGLEKLVKNNVYLVVTFYAMSPETYKAATGSDCFENVLGNVNKLINMNYEAMQLYFLVSSVSFKEIEKFCDFVEENKQVKAVVINNCYEGGRYWTLMRQFEQKYARISARLKFQCLRETFLQMTLRKLYAPIHSLRYRIGRRSL
ncbi:MAG: radical SAM protein [Candidatus Omnitrophica bacterium]|nr:radical SAM protein [Candidatus Omnitrophota bacterium]